MATLGEIRDFLKETVKSGVSGMHCYDTVGDATNLPAVVFVPAFKDTVDFQGSYGLGMHTWNINASLLVARGADLRAAQGQLDQYIGSVYEALRDEQMPDGTLITLVSLDGYGGAYDTANTPCIGAVFHLVIRTPGTA